MRFKKGSKVEVLLTRNEFPTGAWRCAEIISGNGHTYSVKYGWFPITGESASVERVPRKLIRPCPPPINGTDNWVSGDVLEVFDELCWKPAVIVRISGGNNYSVRILGSSSELEARQSRLRVRQSWEDGNWFLVGKGSLNSSGPSKRKRSSLGLSDADGKKTKLIENCSIGGGLIVRLHCPAFEKVDAFVSPKNIVGERCMPSSFRRIDDTMSCSSSVGSCSDLGNKDLYLSSSYVANGCENLEGYCSDAESSSKRSCCGEEGSYYSTSMELGMDIHRSELHAYQKALGALHASGPLTWENQEKNISWPLLEASIFASKAMMDCVCHLLQLTREQHPWFILKGTLKPAFVLKAVLQLVACKLISCRRGYGKTIVSSPHSKVLYLFIRAKTSKLK